jgi:hypothetical protein
MGRQSSSCFDNEEQLRLAYSIFSSRLRDDFQSAGLTCFHHVLQASLTTPSADLLVLFNAFTFWIMPQFNLTVNKTDRDIHVAFTGPGWQSALLAG